MTVGQRIEKLRKQLPSLSQAELSRRVGISQSALNGLIRGDARSSKHLHRIARELGTSVEYLAGDVDDPGAEAAAVPTSTQVAEQLNSVLIPYYDFELSMGGGSVIEDRQPTSQVPFLKDWLRSRIEGRLDQIIMLSGRGDSMQPTISNGDVVLVDTSQREVRESDQIWAFNYGDAGMIKRLRRRPGDQIEVLSDNAAVRPFQVSAEELAMIGRVFWIGRWT